jgi:triosephosphate isomerase (TIM)
MKGPLLVVNFKTYPNATGEKALALALLHEKVAKAKNVSIAIAVQAVDLKMIASEVDIPVLAQHFDLSDEGPFTGHITPYSLKAAGAYGSLLNHSEKRLSLDDIEESLDIARRLGLFTIACADTAYSGKALSELDPNMVAIEPPELIGGEVSVCTARPQLIPDSVNMIGRGKVLVGAGIKSREDVVTAIRGGASGVLVSSGIVKALDPEKILHEMVEGLLVS